LAQRADPCWVETRLARTKPAASNNGAATEKSTNERNSEKWVSGTYETHESHAQGA
jgi:hypothetical protein